MKKTLAVGLIFGYLFMALVLSHVHNHPLTEAGDESCPAYIIASVVFGEDVPSGLAEVAAIEFNGVFIQMPPAAVHSQAVLIRHSNRAPPVSCS